MRCHILLSIVGLTALVNGAPAPQADDESAKPCAQGPIIRDGDFENGKEPPTSGGNSWNVVGFIGSSTYDLTSPGSSLGGGQYAFEAIVRPGPFTNGASGETLTQTLHTCPGKNYSIVADYRFAAAVDNQCSLTVQYPFKDTVSSVITGSAISQAGVWSRTSAFFQAVSTNSKLDFIFKCAGGVSNSIAVDSVKVKRFNGNAF